MKTYARSYTPNWRGGRNGRWSEAPPCQAYSLAGRSRMMGNPEFAEDPRHFLYQEYLQIIIDHRPPVFVMENVKGLLSAKVNGQLVINGIVSDLSCPKAALGNGENGLKYKLYSLSEDGEIKDEVNTKSFLVSAEDYGVPQARHRMFIVGIRSDLSIKPVNAGLKLLHSPERKYLSLTGIGLSIDPHSGVPPNSDAVVRGCGQTGGRCLGFRLCLTVGCV